MSNYTNNPLLQSSFLINIKEKAIVTCTSYSTPILPKRKPEHKKLKKLLENTPLLNTE